MSTLASENSKVAYKAAMCGSCRTPKSPAQMRSDKILIPRIAWTGSRSCSRWTYSAYLTNGHAELEGCENEGNSANDLGMTAGSWIVFENETGVDIDRERIAVSDGSRVEAAPRTRKLLLTSPVVH